MTPEEFAQKIKAKYPVYKDMPDVDLAKKIVEKYPAYANQVDFSEKKGAIGNAIDVAKGFVKATGRTVANALRGASENMSVVGVGPVGFNPVKSGALEPVDQALEAKNTAQKIGGYAETAAEVALPLVAGKSYLATEAPKQLFKRAYSLYKSALKPSTTLSQPETQKIVQTGLKEGITISETGLQKAQGLIDDLEGALDNKIKELSGKGKTIKISELKPFVDEAKGAIQNITDVKYAEKAKKAIDSLYASFVKKYGTDLPIEAAQSIKTSTYKWLRNSYGELSSPLVEANKQLARGIKEGIAGLDPVINAVNQRLGGLYKFSDVLERAVQRTTNNNAIGLGTKVLLSRGGATGTVLSVLNEFMGPVRKSFTAIQMNKLAEKLSTLNPQEQESLTYLLKKALGKVGALGAASATSKINN